MEFEMINKVKARLDERKKWYNDNVSQDHTRFMKHYSEVTNVGLEMLGFVHSLNDLNILIIDLEKEFEPDLTNIKSFNQLSYPEKTLLNATNAGTDELKAAYKFVLDTI